MTIAQCRERRRSPRRSPPDLAAFVPGTSGCLCDEVIEVGVLPTNAALDVFNAVYDTIR